MTGKYVEKGYEFTYEVELVTNVGVFTETRSLFIPQDDFDMAMDMSRTFLSDAEMEEGCNSARPVSLTPKTRARLKV